MRGSLLAIFHSVDESGIIPAHAGLTYALAFHHVSKGDHPRACGAHLQKISTNNHCLGSSPRMRGSHAAGQHRRDDGGIIPAHAGLTIRRAFSP